MESVEKAEDFSTLPTATDRERRFAQSSSYLREERILQRRGDMEREERMIYNTSAAGKNGAANRAAGVLVPI